MATDGTCPLPNFVRPGGGGPVQVIIPSYKFNCYGQITEWRAFVERRGPVNFDDQPYSVSFQVWRPNSPPDGQYTIVEFSPIPLADPNTDRGIVTGVPLESERIEVQSGDVVGFYLESSIMMMMVSSLLETILIMFGSILLVVLHSTHLVCIRLVISAP